VIDSPGMRELQLWEGDGGIDRSFSDIAALAERCRFNDCAHDREPGCAVGAALATSELSQERFDSYKKQLRELAAIARRKNKRRSPRVEKRRGLGFLPTSNQGHRHVHDPEEKDQGTDHVYLGRDPEAGDTVDP